MSTEIVQEHLRLLPGVPLIDSPFFDEICASGYFDAETLPLAQQLNAQGFAILEFPDADVADRAERIKANLAPKFAAARAGGERFDGRLMPPRFQDAWEIDADVEAIASSPRMLALLSHLYGRAAFPFQSLNFEKGSQQHAHTDAVHFNSYPQGFMCGVWVALEDAHADNGPLFYYPGSHRWAIYDNEQTTASADDRARPSSQAVYQDLWKALIRQKQCARQTFHPRKGQALIWTANLLHGGSDVLDPQATRWSQVTHYYFENCAYYRPMASHLLPGEVAFITPNDVARRSVVHSRYAGELLPAEHIAANQSRVAAREKKREASLPADFDAARYLALNPDVADAGADAAFHYTTHGRLEGRRYR